MEETVMFRAPVEVTVDMETGTVTSVVVHDTQVEYDDLTDNPGADIARNAEWPEWVVGR